MKTTIKDIITNVGQSSAAPSHVYDPHTKKIRTTEMHQHLTSVRDDIASGKPVWIPRGKR